MNYVNSYIAEIILSQLHFKTGASGCLNLKEYIHHFVPFKNMQFAFSANPYFNYDAPDDIAKIGIDSLVRTLNTNDPG